MANITQDYIYMNELQEKSKNSVQKILKKIILKSTHLSDAKIYNPKDFFNCFKINTSN